MTDSFFTHAVRCSLVDYLDHSLLLQLRDGSTVIGSLMTFDQYSNIVLGQCVARVLHTPEKIYSDTPNGTMLVRGENIVMLGKLKDREMKGWKQMEAKEVNKRIQKWKEDHAGELSTKETFDEE